MSPAYTGRSGIECHALACRDARQTALHFINLQQSPSNIGGLPAHHSVNIIRCVLSNTSPPPCTSSGTTTCIDIENCNHSNEVFFDTAYNDNNVAASYFDDFIVWGSNALQRSPVNNLLYGSGCPSTSICESWCASCGTNYPGGGATAPPTDLTNPVLCRKVITTQSSTCSAYCFWSGGSVAGDVECS